MSEVDAPRDLEAARAGAFSGLQGADGAELSGVYLHVWRFVVAMVEDVGGFDGE